MTPYELLALIGSIYGPEETIEIVNDLIDQITNTPYDFAFGLSENISEYAENHNLCPLCRHKLVTTEYTEDRGEYQGFPSQETMYRTECENPSCSYSVE